MKKYKHYLLGLPLIFILLLIYKFRYKLELVKAPDAKVETVDSSYYYRKPKDIAPISHGYVMGREFHGIDATKNKIDHLMDSGMDMISNDQYYLIKLFDPKQKIEIYIAIRDFRLLERVPFSSKFDDGQKILITAFIRNEINVNVMYGGTIYNNEGKLQLNHYNKNSRLISGVLNAKLQAVTANGYCRIENLVFTNALADFSN